MHRVAVKQNSIKQDYRSHNHNLYRTEALCKEGTSNWCWVLIVSTANIRQSHTPTFTQIYMYTSTHTHTGPDPGISVLIDHLGTPGR